MNDGLKLLLLEIPEEVMAAGGLPYVEVEEGGRPYLLDVGGSTLLPNPPFSLIWRCKKLIKFELLSIAYRASSSLRFISLSC